MGHTRCGVVAIEDLARSAQRFADEPEIVGLEIAQAAMWISLRSAEEVPSAKSRSSAKATDRPRPAASQATAAPG